MWAIMLATISFLIGGLGKALDGPHPAMRAFADTCLVSAGIGLIGAVVIALVVY